MLFDGVFTFRKTPSSSPFTTFLYDNELLPLARYSMIKIMIMIMKVDLIFAEPC